MTTYSDIVKDDVTGQPVAGASVYVYNLDKSLASITPTNPVVTDSYGEFSFTAADGLYRVSYVVGGKTVEKDYIIVGVGPSIPVDVIAALIPFLNQITNGVSAAANSSAQAGTYAGSAASSAGSATTSASQASAYATAAALAAGNIFGAAADGVSNGVISTTGLVAGSGGTNGTFDVAFSGGAGTGAAARFTVAGGALTSITIVSKGVNYTSAPTMSFAASTGLSGASATAVIGPRTAAGDYFLVVGSGTLNLYKNVAGVATAQNIPIATATDTANEDTRALLAALPRGPLGVWAFDRYASSSIPNLIDSAAPIAVSSGSLSAGAFTGKGTIALSSAVTLSRFTISVLVQVNAINSYNMIVYDTADYNNFGFQSVSTLGGSTTGGPAWVKNIDVGRCGAVVGAFQGQRGGLLNLVGKGYHVLTLCQDATSVSLWIDDVKLYTDMETVTFSAISNLTFGIGPDATQSAHNYAGFMGLWDRALSDTEIRNVVYQQKARAVVNAIVPTGVRTNRYLFIEGDSNHGQIDANSWPWQYGAHDSPEVFGAAYSITGSTLTSLQARAPALDALIPPDTYGRKLIMTVGIGTNDLQGYNSTTITSTYIPALRAYMVARKNAGFKMALFTVPRRGDLAGATATNFETVRGILNADILANPTAYGLVSGSQVIDIGSAAHIGSSYDAAYYNADQLHFNATGSAVVEGLARTVINAM